jgi:inorganic triphosphatase YgiF
MSKSVVHVHLHFHMGSDPSISAKLDQLIAAAKQEFEMSKEVDAEIKELGNTLLTMTDAVTAVSALLDARNEASEKLAAEMESNGQDATALRELNASFAAQRDTLVAKTLANTQAA